jgi:purine-binding chemotaxis protein CheW
VRLLLFVINDVRYAMRSETVAEIIRAVAVTPLPNAPAVIEGIIDLRGRVVPVFDLRLRFGLASRPVAASDHFIIARATSRLAALHVDRVLDLVDVADDAIDATGQPSARHVAGVALLGDGMALIHDLDTFLTTAEAETLDAALEASAGAGRGR